MLHSISNLYKKRLFRWACICLCIAVLLPLLNTLFISKSHRAQLRHVFYDAPENSYDILYLGSSHMNGGLDPAPLESETGVRGYNLATGGQPFDVTYYVLKEALKRQSPKVVVLDTYYLCNNVPYGKDSYMHFALDAMNLNQNKLDAVFHSVGEEGRAKFLFPFLEYHSRWNSLTAEDYAWNTPYTGNGFDAGTNTYGQELQFDEWTDETTELPAKMQEYLLKFFNLAKEENFQLILVNFPSDYTFTASDDTWVSEPHKVFNQTAKLAEQNDVSFINFCTPEMMQTIGFDFSNDMNNSGHVNHNGAEKITTWFDDYLKEAAPQLFSQT